MQTNHIALLLLPLALQLIVLVFSVTVDPYIQPLRRKLLLLIAALDLSLIAIDITAFFLKFAIVSPMARTIVDICGYSVRPLIILLFSIIICPSQQFRVSWALVVLNIAVHLTALFSPVCFTITEANEYVRGPLGYCCHVVSAVLLGLFVYLTRREYRKRRGEAWIPFVIVLLVTVSVVLDSLKNFDRLPITLLTIAIVSTSVFCYIWLHLQFVREHEQALMSEQRIQIMMSQIQPHFLYNTLSTIQALCHVDAEKAADITEKFALYLRSNLDSLSQTDLIPIEKELEHTKAYTDIEITRFPNIRMEYAIEDRDFSVPPLSVQPLVENAIRHGVRIRREGLVQVSTRREARAHVITVRDNGRGFDPAKLENLDGSHLGIRNVRERVESMCGGTLQIDSAEGEGTVVTIRLPAKEL